MSCPCGCQDTIAELGDAQALLKQAGDALWACAKAALTVKPTLDQPYPDDPRWSPWTRWVERPAREAHDTAMAIRKHLKGAPGILTAVRASSGDTVVITFSGPVSAQVVHDIRERWAAHAPDVTLVIADSVAAIEVRKPEAQP